MKTKRVTMRKIKEILRQKYECLLSHSQISRSCKVAKGTISNYCKLAEARGLKWPIPDDLDDDAIYKLLFDPNGNDGDYLKPDFAMIHQELKRKGVTLQLLWEEYSNNLLLPAASAAEEREKNLKFKLEESSLNLSDNSIPTKDCIQIKAIATKAYSYARYCHLYRKWAKKLKTSMRQQHQAGEKLFVDYSGKTMPIYNPDTGEVKEAEIFVAAFGASSFTYAEASYSQNSASWIASHVNALGYFGGSPAIIVPDNLRAATTLACRYDPELNRSYAEFAEHYNLSIVPARSYKPKDKAIVENSVLIVQRWILARLRNLKFFSLDELNQEIRKLLDVLNHKQLKNFNTTRHELFITLDKPLLQPLPSTEFCYAEWQIKRAGLDYHVEIGKHYYSGPYALAQEQVEVRFTHKVVEIIYRGKRVASHVKSDVIRGVTTDNTHMPKAHKKHKEWSAIKLLNWAASIGTSTKIVITNHLENKNQEAGFKVCLGINVLAKHYGDLRLERACCKAISIGAVGYRNIKSILDKNIENQLAVKEEEPSSLPENHANLRGAKYYANLANVTIH